MLPELFSLCWVRRFRDRLINPLKRWKLSYEDFRNRAHRSDYVVAIEDMFASNGARRAEYEILPNAIFTDPELGSVGLTEAEARAEAYEVDVVKHPLSAVTRAQFSTSRRGLYKIVFDRTTRKVLGVHVVSRGASDIVGSLALALRLGVTVDDMALVHHVYPSYSEGLKAAAERAIAPVRV